LVRVEEAEAANVDRLPADSVVVVVRWTGDCGRRRAKLDTLEVGTRQIFQAVLRPDSLWIDNRPTFDVPPGLLGVYPGTTYWPNYLDTFREFLAELPSPDEWRADCRTGAIRIDRWFHRLSNRKTRYHYPFTAIRSSLRAMCETEMKHRARKLERWEATAPIPDDLRDVLWKEGCREGSDVWGGWDTAVNGHFRDLPGDQWTVICPRSDDWRLLIVQLSPSVQVVEVARLAGNDWDWLAGAAPAEYLELMTSETLEGEGRWTLQRPRHDVVLLEYLGGVEDQIIAFYETESGWNNVGVYCCYWYEAEQAADVQ
jgi:hypothetical protein